MPNNLLPITIDWQAPTHEIRQSICSQVSTVPARIKIIFPENCGIQSGIHNLNNPVEFAIFLVKLSNLGKLTSRICPEILPSLAIMLD